MSCRLTNPGARLHDSRKTSGSLSCRTLTWPNPSTTPWAYKMRFDCTSLSTRSELGFFIFIVIHLHLFLSCLCGRYADYVGCQSTCLLLNRATEDSCTIPASSASSVGFCQLSGQCVGNVPNQ